MDLTDEHVDDSPPEGSISGGISLEPSGDSLVSIGDSLVQTAGDSLVQVGDGIGHTGVTFIQSADGLVTGEGLDGAGITLVQPGDSIEGLEAAFSVASEGLDTSNAQFATINGQPVIILAAADESTVSALQQEQVEEPSPAEAEPESLEPAAKRFKVEREDGRTFVVSVNPEGNTTVEGEVTDSLEAEGLEAAEGDELTQSAVSKEGAGDTDVSQAWFTTKDDKTALRSKGCQWRQGQWSREEVEVLQANIAGYCKDNNIGDPTEVIFEMTKDERKDFYRTIARGLQRPLFSVYRRVIRMYDQRNHIGKYSPEEIKKLKELRAKYGSDWATIGGMLGRSASSVKDRCRLMKDTCNTGKWLPEEERRLTAAVYEQSGAKPGENIDQGLSWSLVAEKVSTRSEKQCRTKWLNYLNWKHRGGTEWTREDDIALIYKIVNCGVSDESELDWRALAKDWSSARSPQWLRGKWWTLKRHVPDYQLLPFADIVEFLRAAHTQNLWVGVEHLHLNQRLELVTGIDKTNVEGTEGKITLSSDGAPMGAMQIVSGLGQTHGPLRLNANLGQGAPLLITQPQNNPAISMAGGNITSDHIIVHTLPVSQLQTEGGLSVQMSASDTLRPFRVSPQVMINTSVPDNGTAAFTTSTIASSDVPKSATLQFTDAIENSEEDLRNLAESAQITVEAAEEETIQISGPVLSTDAHIIHTELSPDSPIQGLQPSDHSELGAVTHTELDADAHITHAELDADSHITHAELDTEGETTKVIIEPFPPEGMDGAEVQVAELDGSVVATSDLVLVSSSEAQFVQSGSADHDLIHMSSLSDPMLTSESVDLMGSCSDVEGDKTNSNDGVTDDSPS